MTSPRPVLSLLAVFLIKGSVLKDMAHGAVIYKQNATPAGPSALILRFQKAYKKNDCFPR